MMTGTIVQKYAAGAPRGSWPAEEHAALLRSQGQPAEVVMDLIADAFLVVTPAGPDAASGSD